MPRAFNLGRFAIALLIGISSAMLVVTGIYAFPQRDPKGIGLLAAFVIFVSLTGSVLGGAFGRPGLGCGIGFTISLWLACWLLIMS
jgi:hypothetical protein